MPLTRRIPKRGFTNIFRIVNQVVSFEDLGRLPKGAEVTEEALAAAGAASINVFSARRALSRY